MLSKILLSFVSKAKKTSQAAKDKCKDISSTPSNVGEPQTKSKDSEPKTAPIVSEPETKTVISEAGTKTIGGEPEINSIAVKTDVEKVQLNSNNNNNNKASPIKHPLNSKWTHWYYFNEKNKDWKECQHKIHTVDTVEDFWSFVNHLRPPSELTSGVDYSFFKNGIRPEWEDEQNVKGGRLTVISAPKAKSALIDEVWLDILLFLIGEKEPYADDVCGVVLNVRQYGFKLAVWTSVQDKERVASIKNSIKDSLSTNMMQSISFEGHQETQKKAYHGKSSSKSLY